MPRSILIVDSNPGFAGMLEQAFTGAGLTCTPALTAEEAVRIASSIPLDLAIIDFHIPDASPRDLVRALRALHPSAILLGIPLDNNPDNPILDDLGMQGGLFKPFYLPSLVPYIARILGESIPAVEIPDDMASLPMVEFARPQAHRSTLRNPWLNDSEYLANILAQTARENSVVACMVTRGAELRAWAGSLPRDELSLIARKVVESWADNSGGTLARYIQMPSTGADIYLYSTSLTVDLDLSLLFEPKTPLSITRRRALNFLRALEREPGTASAGEDSPTPSASRFASSLSAPAEASRPRPNTSIQQQIDRMFARGPHPPDEFPPSQRRVADLPMAAMATSTSSERMDDEFVKFSPPKIKQGAQEVSGSEDDMRSSDADANTQHFDPLESFGTDTGEISQEDSESASQATSNENGRSGSAWGQPPSPGNPRRNRNRGDFADAMQRRLRKNAFRIENAPPPNPERVTEAEAESGFAWDPTVSPAGETFERVRLEELPVDVGLENRSPLPAGFESPSPALVKLCYAVVLTPSFPGSRLSPEMATDLEECIRNLAVSYGWKTLRTVIQSGFLAVNIVAPPHVAPVFVIRVLRRQTSQRLLARFPALAESNPAPDFWAPGYLLIGTDQPPTPQQVTDYIAYTRRAQGLGSPASSHG